MGVTGNPLHKPAKTENANNNEGDEEVQSDLFGYRSSERIWLMKVSFWSHGETRCLGIKTLPVLLMNYQSMESRAKVELGSGKHRVDTHVPRDPNCDICKKTKITRVFRRRGVGIVVPRAEHFGDSITADHTVLSEGSESRKNHRYAVVVQDLATLWLQSYPCKTKTSQEIQKSLMKFLEPTRKPKVIYANNSLEFDRFFEDLSSNHCTSTPHRSETNGIAERAVREVKEGTSAVLSQSGLDNSWWADSMECCCYLRNIQDLFFW